jgi:hypothetical protein
MQKGEDMHRRCCGLGGAIGSLALICVPWFAVAAHAADADSNSPGFPARMLVGCPQGVASKNSFFESSGGGRKSAGFHATAANPYMIDGLASSDLLFGIDGESFSAWIDWSHLGYALYREDRLAAAMGILCPFRAGLRIYAIPAIERRAARGFSAESSRSLSLAVSYEYRGRVSVGYVSLAAASEVTEPRNSRAFMFARVGFFAIAVDRAISGPRGSDAQCVLEAWFGDTCAFISAYRWKTGEISNGIVVRASRTILDFTWSRNPALGSTLTAGIGRSWKW